MPLTLDEEEELEFEVETAKARSAAKAQSFNEEVQAQAPAATDSNTSTYLKDYEEWRPGTMDPSALPGAISGLGKGLWNAATETVKTVGAIGESALDATNRIENPVLRGILGGTSSPRPEGTEGAATEMLEQIPRAEYQQDSAEALVGPVTEIGAGLLAGDKGAKTALKALPKATTTTGRTTRAVGRAAGEGLGAAITTDKNAGTLVTGDDSILGKATGGNADIPSVGGNVEEGDSPADARVKKTVAMAQDAVLAAGLANKVASGTMWGLGWAKNVVDNLRKYNDTGAMADEYADVVLKRFTALGDDASSDEIAQAYNDTAEYLEKNSKGKATFGDADVADKEWDVDVVDNLISKLDPKDPKELLVIKEFESLKASALAGGKSPALQINTEKPKEVLKESLEDFTKARGGNEAIEQTGEAIVQAGKMDVATTKVPAYEKTQELSTVNQQTEDVMRTDPQFGPAVQKAETSNVSVDPTKPTREAQSKLTHTVKDADLAADTKTNQAYKQVADSGAPSDVDSFMGAREAGREMISAKNNSVLDKLMEASDGSFGYLYTKVRPKLEDMIKGSIKGTDELEFKALKSIKDNIDKDQMAALESNVDEFGYSTRTAKEAKEAKAAHIEEQTTWGDGLASDMRKNRLDNRPDFKPLKFEVGGNKTLMAAIKDPDRAKEVQQLRNAVGIKNAPLFDDVVVAEIAKDALTSVTNKGGKLKDVDVQAMISSVQKMSAGLSAKNKARLEQMFTKVRDGNLKGEALQEELKELTKQAKVAEDQIYLDYLGDFIKKSSDGSIEKSANTFADLEKLFNSPKSKDKIAKLVSITEGDETARKGLQAAWAKYGREFVENQKNVPAFTEDFITYGKQIYGEDSLVPDMISELNKKAGGVDRSTREAIMGQGLPVGKNQEEATRSVGTIITFIWGVLNPTAAKIRRISSDVLKENDSGVAAGKVIDSILSNSNEFASIARRLAKDQQGKLSPENKKRILKLLTMSGIYGPGVGETPLDNQTKQMTK
jgi:hypothetical protein